MSTKRHVNQTDGLTWHKSSYSGSDGGNCVEVARGTEAVFVRDSKNARGPVLSVEPHPWTAFLSYAARQPAD